MDNITQNNTADNIKTEEQTMAKEIPDYSCELWSAANMIKGVYSVLLARQYLDGFNDESTIQFCQEVLYHAGCDLFELLDFDMKNTDPNEYIPPAYKKRLELFKAG